MKNNHDYGSFKIKNSI